MTFAAIRLPLIIVALVGLSVTTAKAAVVSTSASIAVTAYVMPQFARTVSDAPHTTSTATTASDSQTTTITY